MKKEYLIIGASSEVGMAYIKHLDALTAENVTVVAHYGRNRDGLEKLQDKLNHITMYMVEADLTKEDGAERICSHVRDNGHNITHVLHLAALPLSYMKIKKWDQEIVKSNMQLQFFSFTEIMRELLPQMAKSGYGRVAVMLSSAILGTPPKFMSDYLAVKSALWGYIKGAAAEYGDKGIRINGISPNMMETKFLDKIDDRIVQMTAQSSALKRNINVEETVKGIQFLLSDDVSYINGINLNLSGGDYMV